MSSFTQGFSLNKVAASSPEVSRYNVNATLKNNSLGLKTGELGPDKCIYK